jgi:hypothetical protein
LKPGFSARATGLSFIKPEKFQRYTFIAEDISGAGLSKFLPWRAAFFRAYLCRQCEFFMVDYSRSYSRKEANAIAATLL